MARFFLRVMVWIRFMIRVIPRFRFGLGKGLVLLLVQAYGKD